MIPVKDYLSEKYDALRPLRESEDLFRKARVDELLNTKVCDLFLKYNIHETYGVSLLHRHFDMDAGEKLVENGSVSAPWAYHQPDDDLYGGSVVPRSWMFSDGALYPYEFGYNSRLSQAYPSMPINNDFLAEFHELLEEHHLTDILGLTSVSPLAPGSMKYEKTWGRAMVVFTMAEDALDAMGKETINALWYFGSVKPSAANGYRVMGCAVACKCHD
jgi:hypothetical protein